MRDLRYKGFFIFCKRCGRNRIGHKKSFSCTTSWEKTKSLMNLESDKTITQACNSDVSVMFWNSNVSLYSNRLVGFGLKSRLWFSSTGWTSNPPTPVCQIRDAQLKIIERRRDSNLDKGKIWTGGALICFMYNFPYFPLHLCFSSLFFFIFHIAVVWF